MQISKYLKVLILVGSIVVVQDGLAKDKKSRTPTSDRYTDCSVFESTLDEEKLAELKEKIKPIKTLRACMVASGQAISSVLEFHSVETGPPYEVTTFYAMDGKVIGAKNSRSEK